jgi:hypothetical protein
MLKPHFVRGAIAILLLLSLPSGCAAPPPAPAPQASAFAPRVDPLVAQIDQARARARQFLVSRQSPDGAWRSDVYGFLKDGPSLSPHVLLALRMDIRGELDRSDSTRRGVNYLASLVDANGKLSPDLDLIYPVYTAAEAIPCVKVDGISPKVFIAWLDLLREHQLAEQNGWQPTDVDYGGWGYAQQPPTRKPDGAFRGPWDWSNLSATADAVDAVRAADLNLGYLISGPVLQFIERCQNYRDPADAADDPLLDGGFFFAPSAAIRNKAGSEIDSQGRERFHSYGSTTCDGIRALRQCGLSNDHPRVLAARRWLAANFSVEHNPGKFIAGNEDLRDATYYYYLRSLARALEQFDEPQIQTSQGNINWPRAIAEELLKRQRADGSWVNRYTDGREDDPLVATPLALSALDACRRSFGREWREPLDPGLSR